MENSFTPVSYDFREIIADRCQQATKGKIFFFNAEAKVDDAEGVIQSVEEINNKGIFITLDSQQIRIDRIITLFGRPGPAYDEYDAFANACLDCTGGYDL